jgi:hypothetical protein
MASEPSPIVCIEKQRLIQEYTNAVSECNRLQSAQVLAVRRAEDFTFEEEIAKASQRREYAKYAIMDHSEKHGC